MLRKVFAPIMLLLLVCTSTTQAATFVVDRADDPFGSADACTAAASDCSLRGAIGSANTSGGPDLVTVDPSVSAIVLGSPGQIGIIESVTIVGNSASGTTVTQSDPGKRILNASTASVALTLQDLTLSGGDPATDGGAIAMSGNGISLILSRVIVSGNRSDSASGGGVFVNATGGVSTVSITDSWFTNNDAVGGAGGGLNSVNAGLTIERSTFSNNDAGGGGGGAYQSSGSTVNAITNSTFHANSATGFGGAIDPSGNTTIRSVTFSDNRSDSDNMVGGDGGAIGNPNAVSSLANSLFYRNRHTGDAANDCPSGVGIDGGNNASDVTGVTLCVPTYLVLTGAFGLPTFGPYGGVSNTYPLSAGQSVIDAGNPTLCGLLSTDQRGGKRTVGTACDIGAIEFGGLADTAISGTTTPSAFAAGGSGTITASLVNNGADPAFDGTVTATVGAGASITAMTMDGGTCVLATGVCTRSSVLNTAETSAVTVTVSASSAGSYAYSLTAGSSANDSVTSNQTATGAFTVTGATTTSIPPTLVGAIPSSVRIRRGRLSFRLGCRGTAGTTCTISTTMTSKSKLAGRKRKVACSGRGTVGTTFTVTCSVAKKVRKALPSKGANFIARTTLKLSDGQRKSIAAKTVRIKR